MYWREVSKCDKQAIAFAQPHYSIQTPNAAELGPPGQKIVLMGSDDKALWGSHRPAPWAGIKRMDGFDGHSCFIFRNEGGPLSSTIIREAVALTVAKWGLAAFITYVALKKIKNQRNPGYCFLMAGFHRVAIKAKTKHGPMLRLEMDKPEVKRCAIQHGIKLKEKSMSKRITESERVITFFQTAPMDEVASVFNLCKRLIFNRQYATKPTPVEKPKVKRHRRTKAEIEASKAIDKGIAATQGE